MAARQVTLATNRRPDNKLYFEGGAAIQGFDVTIPEKPQAWNFYVDMCRDAPWDIGEVAFSQYVIARDCGKPLTAIPAFQDRFFPHYGTLVHNDANISSPQDLVGKVVGASGWGMSPAVWLRGALTHQYDVPTERIIWAENEVDPLFGGLHYPHSPRYTFKKLTPPADLALSPRNQFGVPNMLDSGEVDAAVLYGLNPATTERTRRLFADPAAEARQYAQQTGIIPLHSVFVVRQESVERYPDLAPAALEMVTAITKQDTEQIASSGAGNQGYVPVDLAKELGLYPLRQGFEANRAAIQMMITYCYEQGLIRTLYRPEDLFMESCL